MTTRNDPLIGQQLGDYTIVGVIGRGGMGRVYKGFDEKLQRHAAVKVFDARDMIGDEMEEYRQRFQREARSVARLRHPNIVDVYQTGQSGTLYYMAMTLVEGNDLRTILKEYAARNATMPGEEIVRIMTDMAAALDYAHSEGVIHRDVKPSNIMVKSDGHAILTDFGLALNVPEGTLGSTFGSVHYIAPEQAMNSAMAVPQSDLYSLGVVLYEMLAGQVPFDDASAMNVALKHLSEAPPPLHEFKPSTSLQVETMVMRTLDKEPTRRYATGEAFVHALENALGLTDQDEETRKVIIPEWVREYARLAEERTDGTLPDPVVSSGDAETIIPRTPVKHPKSAEGPAASRRLRNLALLGLAAVIVLIAVIVMASSSGGAATPQAVPSATVFESTTVPAAALATTASPTESDTPTSQPTATDEPTLQPTAPAATRAAPAADSAAEVELIYDDESLVLINRADAPIDVSGITFVQPVSNGNDLEFTTLRWDGGAAPPGDLPPGDCFQVFTVSVLVGDTPPGCNVRHKWDQASAPRWFWISDDPDTLFEVWRGDELLAECRVGDGECRVNLG